MCSLLDTSPVRVVPVKAARAVSMSQDGVNSVNTGNNLIRKRNGAWIGCRPKAADNGQWRGQCDGGLKLGCSVILLVTKDLGTPDLEPFNVMPVPATTE